MITQDLLKELFTYKDGFLYWNKSQGSAKKGSVAGCLQDNGYHVTMIQYKKYKTHRLIFLYHKGYLPEEVDHEDGIKDHNEISNLRPATKADNQHNRKLGRDNTSGVKGVHWHRQNRKWLAQIINNKQFVYLGCFDDIEVASQVIRIARIELHGEFANHGQ